MAFVVQFFFIYTSLGTWPKHFCKKSLRNKFNTIENFSNKHFDICENELLEAARIGETLG